MRVQPWVPAESKRDCSDGLGIVLAEVLPRHPTVSGLVSHLLAGLGPLVPGPKTSWLTAHAVERARRWSGGNPGSRFAPDPGRLLVSQRQHNRHYGESYAAEEIGA